jgi:hypothetical protein
VNIELSLLSLILINSIARGAFIFTPLWKNDLSSL